MKNSVTNKFMDEFSTYRKQEIDIFKSNQTLFVKNLQKQINKLSDSVHTVIEHQKSQNSATSNDDLFDLQDNISNVSNNLQKYFTKIAQKSINDESYFSNNTADQHLIKHSYQSLNQNKSKFLE